MKKCLIRCCVHEFIFSTHPTGNRAKCHTHLIFGSILSTIEQSTKSSEGFLKLHSHKRSKLLLISQCKFPVLSFDDCVAILTARLSHFIALIIKEPCITASTVITDTPCFWVGRACGHLTGIYKAVYLWLVWRTSRRRGCGKRHLFLKSVVIGGSYKK